MPLTVRSEGLSPWGLAFLGPAGLPPPRLDPSVTEFAALGFTDTVSLRAPRKWISSCISGGQAPPPAADLPGLRPSQPQPGRKHRDSRSQLVPCVEGFPLWNLLATLLARGYLHTWEGLLFGPSEGVPGQPPVGIQGDNHPDKRSLKCGPQTGRPGRIKNRK